MNRHIRRAQAKLLESHDRMARGAAKVAFDNWRHANGFVGEDTMQVAVSALQDDAAWSDAERDTETRAVTTAECLLRQYEIRLTEQERDRFFLSTRLATAGLFREFAGEFRDYCAAMVAMGDELDRPFLGDEA